MGLQGGESVSFLRAYLLYAATLVVAVEFSSIGVVLANSSSSSPQIFKVVSGAWGPCMPLNDTQACYKSREVTCVRKTDNATAPWYYCTDIGLERPRALERCLGSQCVQDCAVTAWSSWSPCNCESGFFQSRKRDIVMPARNGGRECPNLLETKKCLRCFVEHRQFESLPRSYTWRTGAWGTCRVMDDDTDCGDGLHTRAVDCVNTEGNVVNATFCINDLAYLHVFPPATTRVCQVPCRCQVGEWTEWSNCMANCSSSPLIGYKQRTRSILRRPTMGETCPHTKETDTCTDLINPVTCPTYSWEKSNWSLCQPQNSDGSCGVGTTHRFIYCVKTVGSLSVAADSSLCDSATQPSTSASCEIPCHQDCQLGEWSDWSECTRACTPTYSNRTRDVLVQPLSGGDACPHLSEYKACPVLPCYDWVPEPYSETCYFTNGADCGEGTRSRVVNCQDLNGNGVDAGNCPSTLLSNEEQCYRPCSDGCVVSDWSDWSECSETCGGAIGSQSRQRYFLASGSTCPYTESDLTESRNCSNSRPCEEEVYYIIEDPWGPCMARDPMSGGNRCEIGNGVQNRTAVCMRGDNALPSKGCPIEYEELQQRPCNISCECEYTEWTETSECSATCGTGMRMRSRRLVRFSDAGADCLVDENGFQIELSTTPCSTAIPCPGQAEYSWYVTSYGDCVPFASVASPHSPDSLASGQCGYGYKNRSVECHHVSSGRTVAGEHCLEIGEEKPSAFEPCAVACSDSCIVTEWSEYTQCTSSSGQIRTREVIPCSRENNLNGCCPKLSSLELSETVDCNSPPLSGYRWRNTDLFGECIVTDPKKTCGNGFAYGPHACHSSTNIIVPADFCPMAPETQIRTSVRCVIPCDTNCEQSAWSDWSECSETCGRGIRMRTRSVVRQQQTGGRQCGPSMETETCETSVCPYAEYVPGQFSTCILNNSDSNSTCGMGMKIRQPICLVNGQRSDAQECERQGAAVTFDLESECTIPCDGDCVASDWGEWSECSCDSMGNCQHGRHRQILRDGTNCPLMLAEYSSCQKYTWQALNWTDCVLPNLEYGDSRPDHYCGNGTKRRSVDCINNHTGHSVHDKFCDGIWKPVQIQSCSRPCPVDCLVGAFSEWTECPKLCNMTVQTRRRSILILPSNGGQECPALIQEKPCPRNCDEYMYNGTHEPRCLPDYSAKTQCGSALQLQPISCRRNHEFVSPSECIEAARRGLTVKGLSDPNVDLSPSYCTIDCPREPACNSTEWSAPSTCRTSCYDRGSPFTFRTKPPVTSFDERSTNASCLLKQYELDIQSCSTIGPEMTSTSGTTTTTALAPLEVEGEMECVAFRWVTSTWRGDDTREVWCESSGEVRVTGGCPSNLIPPTERIDCSSKVCPANSRCNSTSGLCQCNVSRSEMVKGKCLPTSGCFEDGHCLIPNTQCDERVGQCICAEGYELLDRVCTYVPTTPPPTTTTQATLATTIALDSSTTLATTTVQSATTTVQSATTTTEEHVDSKSTTAEALVTTVGARPKDDPATSLGILHIVLIGTVPLVIVIITVIVLILITYRCRVSLEKQKNESKTRRRANLSISSPSPTPQTAEEMMARLGRRGADSASSGFVDDLDNELQKYGMPGNSFLASQHSKHSEDVDEAVFSAPNHPPNPIPVPAPTIPMVATGNPLHPPNHQFQHSEFGESNLDGRMLPHQIDPVYPYAFRDNYQDGDFTTATDVTYTTDEGSVIGTSVPPSDVGSPSIMRRRREEFPRHLQRTPDRFQRSSSRGTENQYVEMQTQPVYASIKHGVRHHDYHHHPQDYRSVKARERSERLHDQSREASQDYLSEPDYARSITPSSPTGRYTPSFSNSHSPTHIPSRDRRIATGLDSSMVRAAVQMSDERTHHSQEDHQEFQRSYHRSSGGSRRSSRRRRRRQPRHHGDGNPHHMTYHPSSRNDYEYYHHDDGQYPNPRARVSRHYSEGDYYYHSDHDTHTVYPAPPSQQYYPPSRSVPMTPTLPPQPPHHHPHSPAVGHGQQRRSPYTPTVVQGHPPPPPQVHSPAVSHGQRPQYSHELQQPSVEVQPPTPATNRRDDVTGATTPHGIPPGSPYVYQPRQDPPTSVVPQQHQSADYPPPGGSTYPQPQNSSTPKLPSHMVPQPSPHLHMPSASGRDPYDNYDLPRSVHAHYMQQEQVRQEVTTPTSSHYAYPRSILSSTNSVPSPMVTSVHDANSSEPHQPVVNGTGPYTSAPLPPHTKSATLQSDISTASSATTYAPQSVASDANSQQGSPYVVRRQHHPSPLVLHSSSSNSPATSSVYTPRGSAEVAQQQQLNLSDALSSFDSPAAGKEQATHFNGQHQMTSHMQYQLHHQMQNGSAVTPRQ